MQVSAIRSFFTHITRVPFYRIPKTLGWPTLNSALGSAADTSSFSPPAYDTLDMILRFLPNFFPEEVRALISQHKEVTATGLPLVYSFEAYAFLQEHGIVPGSSSTDMDKTYTWPANWELTGFDSMLEPLSFASAFHTSHPALLPLLKDLGPTFLRSLTAALLASNGHFPALLLSTLWGLRSGHTTLCVQGIFGSGKTYSASLLLILAASVLELNCILTAEPNLPLATATEAISYMLTDASDLSVSTSPRLPGPRH